MWVPVLLAFACAVVYGVADYCGGRATRNASSTVVSLIGQIASLILVGTIVLIAGTSVPGWHDWAWGGLAGVATAVALGSFYHALSHGAMTVVAPITAVTSAAIPIAFGLITGERPGVLAIFGMVLGVAAVALVSGAIGPRHTTTPRVTLLLALVAGTGFAVIFVALDRTSSKSGMWPLVAARIVSISLAATVVFAGRQRSAAARIPLPALRSESWRLAVIAGIFDMSANVLYVLAVRRGLLSIVVVVAALYPVSTVCLAFGIDKERASRWQFSGMALAVGALVLVSLGKAG